MNIDLHMHTRTGSDGRMTVDEVIAEASRRGLDMLAITDHDSVRAQARARDLAAEAGIRYITGAELNVAFSWSGYRGGKPVSLDFLAYEIDIEHPPLVDKLAELARHREWRAGEILGKLNMALGAEGREWLTAGDMAAIEATADGSIGRPHIASYLIAKGVVPDKQAAFDRYLVRCDVPKLPLGLDEAAHLVHGAGGRLVLAHPNDPNGTSLVKITRELEEQQQVIAEAMLEHIDGVECWHSRHDSETSASYLEFTRRHGLLATGGSDCHQQPVLMGSVDVPDLVAEQFGG